MFTTKLQEWLPRLAIVLMIFILSCNDDEEDILPLEITIAGFNATIDENPVTDTVLGTITAEVNRGNISYQLDAQTPANAMAIDAITGELTVADASLFNFEVSTTLTASVSAEAEGVSETANITITLNDVAEVVTANAFTANVDENPINGLSLGTITASTDAGAALTYSMVTSGNNDAFNIGPNTGELTVADSAVFDFETNRTVTAIFEVSNGVDSEQGTITITLNDSPDNVTTSPFSVTTNENPIADQVVGMVSASSDAGATLTYSLLAGDNASALALNASTGELTVADVTQFDFETNQTLKATYEADNGAVKEQNTITVTINDVAEIVTTTAFAVTIDENPAAGQMLGALSATSDGSASIIYSLVTGANSSAFAINASTGELTVADASQFDFETNPTLTATYSASADEVTETGSITIMLNDLIESTQRPLIILYNVLSTDLEIRLQPAFGLTANFDVDWGDGTISTGLTDNTIHTYAAAGQYDLKIYGTFPGWRNEFSTGISQIVGLKQWGDHQYESLNYSFAYSNDFSITATDVPDFSQLTLMVGCFYEAKNFQGNGNLSTWDVSNVTDMLTIFRNVDNFQGDVSNWDVSSVTSLEEAFRVIGTPPAQPFNEDISGWDVSMVTNFSFAFLGNSAFNQDLSGWVTSSATTMEGIFLSTRSFDSDLSGWDLSNVGNVENMLVNSGLTFQNYDATLNGWANNPNTPDNLTLGATGLEYSDVTGRNILIGKGWTFIGDTYLP